MSRRNRPPRSRLCFSRFVFRFPLLLHKHVDIRYLQIFEWEADAFACELQSQLNTAEYADLGDSPGKALITLHVKNLSTVWVDWL